MAQATHTRTEKKGNSWAERLAEHRHLPASQVPAVEADDQSRQAIAALWALFDGSAQQANEALAQAGSTERIKIRQTGNRRSYVLTDLDGAIREIDVTSTLIVARGQRYGGASISTNQTRACIYLEPASSGHETRWIAPGSGAVCSVNIVHDLFLSVFGDDPKATWHLSPISGQELFDIR